MLDVRVSSIVLICLANCAGPTSPATAPEAVEPASPPIGEPRSESSAEPADDEPAVAAADSEEPEPGSLFAKLMRSHFQETAVIRSSVIAGKVWDAVAPAEALVNMEGVQSLPVDWKTSVEELQAASDRIRRSPDVPEAAAATADIGLACGGCHRKVKGGPKLEVSDPPEVGNTVKSRMKRHVWATERLWEGLYVPSDAAWAAGAKALQEDPFPRDALKSGGVYARSSADRFVELAAKAGEQKTPADRGRLYASLLATCASCHAAMTQ